MSILKRLESISYQLIKGENSDDDEKIANSIISIYDAAIGPNTNLIGANLPQFSMGWALRWNGKTITVEKDSLVFSDNLDTNNNQLPSKEPGYFVNDSRPFGDGSDGDLEVTGTVNLNAENTYNYRNLTIRPGGVLNIIDDGETDSKIVILVSENFTIEGDGRIEWIGEDGIDGGGVPGYSGGAGGTENQVYQNGSGERGGKGISNTSLVPSQGHRRPGADGHDWPFWDSAPDANISRISSHKWSDLSNLVVPNGSNGEGGGGGAGGASIHAQRSGSVDGPIDTHLNGGKGGDGGNGGQGGFSAGLIYIEAKECNFSSSARILTRGGKGGLGENGHQGESGEYLSVEIGWGDTKSWRGGRGGYGGRGQDGGDGCGGYVLLKSMKSRGLTNSNIDGANVIDIVYV